MYYGGTTCPRATDRRNAYLGSVVVDHEIAFPSIKSRDFNTEPQQGVCPTERFSLTRPGLGWRPMAASTLMDASWLPRSTESLGARSVPIRLRGLGSREPSWWCSAVRCAPSLGRSLRSPQKLTLGWDSDLRDCPPQF